MKYFVEDSRLSSYLSSEKSPKACGECPHVSVDVDKVPTAPFDADLPALLDDFHAREALRVTFGYALAEYVPEIKAALVKHAGVYQDGLKAHFEEHLRLLK